jgi:hypothetical protein
MYPRPRDVCSVRHMFERKTFPERSMSFISLEIRHIPTVCICPPGTTPALPSPGPKCPFEETYGRGSYGGPRNLTCSNSIGRSHRHSPEKCASRNLARSLSRQLVNYLGFCTASTSLSPLPLENKGLSIVPPIRKGNCNLPSFNAAPDSRATVLVKKLSLVVISANPR